ncbi:gfo/Idh/MocA family oxidoreductase [Blastopirellula marina]|uniref:Gfo/Idh/MocA family oxidoreductase n=1 Tax=Blastopirellula marina TaxID=124 RepID=A0A2S8FGR0_9BACT|nr:MULTISPECIES: Gfo/Idh/MocA family oxidoreductase [Pirellulaceae]PQO31104.1 gfo/Idh/MocA family oxidoreductase [Blastopirellula marina]RCS51498.1 gfo/Idh/MocA family oxidoreductase [Bremerella cremea]
MTKLTRRQFTTTTAAAVASLAANVHAAPAAAGSKIKIGQIGTSHAHASGKMEAMRSLSDTYEVVGLADVDIELAKKGVQRKPYEGLPVMSIEQLLSTPGLQAVAVETEVRQLVPTAKQCIEAGMHIHLDKPAGESLSEFRELCAAADVKKRTIQMGYMLRYNPAFELLFQAAREGWLGEIYEIDSMMGKLASPGLRKDLAQYEGGGLFELACHLIDAVVTILGKPDEVIAFTKRTQSPEDSFADNQLAVLDYPKATATVRCNHLDPFGFPRRRFQVAGSGGALEIKPLESGEVDLSLTEAHGEFKKGTQHLTLKREGGRYDGEFTDLAKVIRGEKELAWDRQHDLAVHEVVLKASGMTVSDR